MNYPRIRISGGPYPPDIKIELNGEEMTHVTGLVVKLDCEEYTIVTLELNAVLELDTSIDPEKLTRLAVALDDGEDDGG